MRRAMTAIRDLVVTNHSLVTHRRMSPSAASRFASDIRATADAVRASQAGSSGEAASELDRLLDRLVTAADAVRGTNPEFEPIDAMIEMDEALAAYAARFDHPGWQAPR
jgi:hypothetical protein